MGECRCCCIPIRKPRTPCGWMCLGVVSLVGSLFMIILGVWAYLFHQSLSPVYTDVKCSLGKMDIQKMGFEGLDFRVDLVSTTVCVNPNPYAVELQSTEGVNVYMGKKRTPITYIKHIEPTILPPRGSGAINVHVKSQPTRAMFGTMFGALFSSQTPIWIENSIALKIEINFYFMKMKLGTSFTKDCAMNVQLLRGAMAKLGPMTCGENFDELEIPPVTGDPFKGELPLYDYHLADDEIKAGTLAKDIGLGVAMASGFGIGSLLVLLGFYSICQFCNSRGARSGDEDRPRRKRERSRERGEETPREKREKSRDKKEKKEKKEAAKEKEKKEAAKEKEKKEAAKEKKNKKERSSREASHDIEEACQKQEA